MLLLLALLLPLQLLHPSQHVVVGL